MNLVIDSSILIDHLRKGSVWKNIFYKISGLENLSLYIPTIVVYELFSGKSSKNSDIKKEIINLLKDFQKISLNEKIAKIAGELNRDTNKTLQAPDYIIAGSTLEIGGMLLTLNLKHFQQIPNLPIYPL